MGAIVSKNEENDTEFPTQHFEKFAHLESLNEDPRSPAADNVTRTPIISYDQVNDPRSPAQYERTPVFAMAEPTSPEIRFMLDNLGFEDSPLSSVSDPLPLRSFLLLKDKNLRKLKAENLTPEVHSDYLDEKDITNCVDDHVSSSLSITKSSSDISPLIKDQNVKKLRSRRSSNKNSLLKQALFKPYIDSNETSEQDTNTKEEFKRKSLGSINNMVLKNPNIFNSKENISAKATTTNKIFSESNKENAPA